MKEMKISSKPSKMESEKRYTLPKRHDEHVCAGIMLAIIVERMVGWFVRF